MITATAAKKARPTAGAAKSGDIALAGKDGAKAKDLLRTAQRRGVEILHEICRDAFEDAARSIARGHSPDKLFSKSDRDRLAEALAATNATADLLGRARVRERQAKAERASGLHTLGDEQPFDTFAGVDFAPLPPERALEYFQNLVPTLGVDPRFAAGHERRAFTLAAATERTLLRKVKQVISAALQSGASADEASADIRDLLDRAGVSPRNPQYAEMVFRTNAMDAYNAGTSRETREAKDFFVVWQYLGIDDERAGDDHRPNHNKYFDSSLTFEEVRGDRPFNCRCVLPGTFVRGRVIAALKSRYSGEIVEIHTANGCRLTVTPNHPILTAHGFVFAGGIKPGDHLVHYRAADGQFADDDEQHAPALIEDIFESLLVEFGVALITPPAPLDFHGDGQSLQGEIHVVRTDGRLLNYGGFQPDRIEQGDFLRAGVGDSALPRLGTIGLASAAERPAVRQSDEMSGAAPMLGFGHSRVRERHGLLMRPQLDALAPKVVSDELPVASESGGDRVHRLAGEVSLDHVVRVELAHYTGPVFDLETMDGFYPANRENPMSGVIVSNCTMRPVDKFEWEELQAKGATAKGYRKPAEAPKPPEPRPAPEPARQPSAPKPVPVAAKSAAESKPKAATKPTPWESKSKEEIIRDFPKGGAASEALRDPWGLLGAPPPVPAVADAIRSALAEHVFTGAHSRMTIRQLLESVTASGVRVSLAELQRAIVALQAAGDVRLAPFTQAIGVMPEEDLRHAFPLSYAIQHYVSINAGDNLEEQAKAARWLKRRSPR